MLPVNFDNHMFLLQENICVYSFDSQIKIKHTGTPAIYNVNFLGDLGVFGGLVLGLGFF